jgi:hypothetical protein
MGPFMSVCLSVEFSSELGNSSDPGALEHIVATMGTEFIVETNCSQQWGREHCYAAVGTNLIFGARRCNNGNEVIVGTIATMET